MSSEFLAAAEKIGRHVVDDAIWHGGLCNWVGVSMDPQEVWQPEYYALEPNLYDGTAGIGLFLAQLAAVTDDDAARRTAVGALRQALTRAPAHRAEGFHAGCLGIAWSAARAAELLDDEELRADALAVPPPVSDGCRDVMLGTAGSTLARVALADLLDEPAFISEAIAGGEQLLAAGSLAPHGGGLCHGTDGVGWALLELFAVTTDERFRDGAEAALSDASKARRRGHGHRHDRLLSPMVGGWCRGEGGSALIRSRAADVLGPDPYEADVATSLEVVRDALTAVLPYDFDDLTLCHGACGVGEVLLEAGEHHVPVALGHLALERYGASGRWPCTPLGGTTPALFRGLTGIGWFYLRLADPSISSPLVFPARLTAATASA